MEVSDRDRAAIREVVEKQLQALQKDDAVGAFAFASPEIQTQFRTADHFMAVVKANYQPVYRPRSVMFRGLTTVDDRPAQKVILMDIEGNLVQAIYLMQRQIDFSWRIHGCFLVPIDEQVT